MNLTKQEIKDFASMYCTEEELSKDFVWEGGVFALIQPNKQTVSYGVCKGYTLAHERGKWINMHFYSLSTFPPTEECLKLQPPHIVKAKFSIGEDEIIIVAIEKIILTQPKSYDESNTIPFKKG